LTAWQWTPPVNNVDAWFQEGDVEHLEGQWDAVSVRKATHTVTVMQVPLSAGQQ
jgi:hypothetical protein